MTTPHIALLGDSIFDNALYVESGQAVTDHLGRMLVARSGHCLLAVDGDTTQDVHVQLQRLPDTSTHLALSVGGNDALGCLPGLDRSTSSVMDALNHLHQIQSGFRGLYEHLLVAIAQYQKPTLVCTIYDAVPGLPPALKTALSLFNDVVTRTALRHQFELLDLRELLCEPADFSVASPIEPSGQGAQKLAHAITRWAGQA